MALFLDEYEFCIRLIVIGLSLFLREHSSQESYWGTGYMFLPYLPPDGISSPSLICICEESSETVILI